MSHSEELQTLLNEIQEICHRTFNWHLDSGVMRDARNRPYAWYYGGYAEKMDVEISAYGRRWVRVMKVKGYVETSEVFRGDGAIAAAIAWAAVY